LEQDHFDQLVHALFCQRGNIHKNSVATPIVRNQPFILQLLTNPQGVGVGVVYFIHCDQHRHFSCLRVAERL